jgi:N-acetylglucosamine kinase-like BadF-type ATPase
MKYYIGVDGGGTKTAFALFDENKNMIETVTGPGSNRENLETSFEGACEILWDGLNALCEKAGIALGDVSFTLMGLAGIDHEYQYDLPS